MIKAIEAILFDWHGVLDRVKFQDIVNFISKTKSIPVEEVQEQLREVKKQYARGELRFFWHAVQEFYGLTGEELQQARDCFLRVEKNEELWALLPQLKAKYRLAIISDCPRDKAMLISVTMDLFYFERVYFSGIECLSKESPAFFHMGLAGLGVQAHHCLFVDDTKQNILYAQNVGLQVHLYTGVGELERILLK